MSEAVTIGTAILETGRMTADDVGRLRSALFDDGMVEAQEADVIFRLNDECRDRDESWNQLYVDALTDYFVWGSTPRGYVSDDQARELLHRIVRNNRIDGGTELELLANILHWADYVPAELAEFALSAVRESVLEPDAAAYGRDRRPGIVDAVDVELIKRAIYAPSGLGSITVTRREADVIFDINDATAHEENHPSWNRLFVYAIANHLMFPRPAPVPEPPEEVLRRERWLKERDGVGGFLKKVGQEAVSVAKGGGVEWDAAMKSLFGGPVRERDPVEEGIAAGAAKEREAISEDEAHWLIQRIDRDGALHPNEVALLKFIKENSPKVDPSLNPLFDKAGLG